MLATICQEAWISLTAYKFRTFLTALGIIIGVCAVVLMVAIGQSVERFIHEKLSGLGSNMIVVLPGSMTTSGVHGGLGTTMTLTRQDAWAIEQLHGVAAVAPIVMSNGQIVYGNENWSAGIVGTETGYTQVMNWDVAKGHAFNDRDIRAAANHVLIGDTVAKQLFLVEDPIGKVIRIKNVPFRVMGVLAEKGQSLDGSNYDDIIVMPITTLRQRIEGSTFPDSVNLILLSTVSEKNMQEVEQQMYQLLRERHRLRPGQDDDFSIRNLTDIINVIKTVGKVLSIFLAAIASISLLVGSIGIMNMMLVSVSERTREIGVRKAIGAPEISIMQQFLLEAILISLFGSLTGLLLGVGISQSVAWLFGQVVPLSFSLLILSVAVALIVGVVSGLFPAMKATRLDPIKALRYE